MTDWRSPATLVLISGIFLSGWAREASSGLVGTARKDGENGAKAMLSYLGTLPEAASVSQETAIASLEVDLIELNKPVVRKPDLFRLEEIEEQRAEELGREDFKFSSNNEMFEAMGLTRYA